MIPKRTRPLIIRTFMTHEMHDDDIAALSTGRDVEFDRVMRTIDRSRKAAPGALQHLVLYGSRGFGKSFMTRRVQIAVGSGDDAQGPVHYLLLPEEQHNLQRSPHAFLEMIASKLENLGSDDDAGYADVLFQWPHPDEDAKRWDKAVKRLDAAVDVALPDKKGLVIVVVENFDALLASLFREDQSEQRLRLWLGRSDNRIMLFATATGTVDLDYDRPLFQAFESIRLPPWNPDDCIAYFNRQRDYDDRPPLTGEQEAKARAIADFIGGTPRLAQLLGNVLDTDDALSVVETMSALADQLAEYYRRRIEDLPPLSRGLLDALIRGGEPASQTELAARVGADGQSRIARVMADLQRADMIRGRPAPDSRETLYTVTDRVFVHYYRLRQGSQNALSTPLNTILDFLKSYYSRDEQHAQALKHLDAGRVAEASLFKRLAMNGERYAESDYTQNFATRLQQYCRGEPQVLGRDINTLIAEIDCAPEVVLKGCTEFAPETHVDQLILPIVKAQALFRSRFDERACSVLKQAFGISVADESGMSKMSLGLELMLFMVAAVDDIGAAATIGIELLDNIPVAANSQFRAMLHFSVGCGLIAAERQGEAISLLSQAAALAKESGQDDIEVAANLALAQTLQNLDRQEEALETSSLAADLARRIEDQQKLSVLLWIKCKSLYFLNSSEPLLQIIHEPIQLAQITGDQRRQLGLQWMVALCLFDLGRYDEAITAAVVARDLAASAEENMALAGVITLLAQSLTKRPHHEAAFTLLDSCITAMANVDETLPFVASPTAWLTRLAGRFPSPSILARYRRCIEALVSVETEDAEELIDSLDSFFIASARASTFADLDAVLEQHGDRLISAIEHLGFGPQDGEVITDVGNESGRSAGFEAAAGLLPRIAAFMARMPEDKRDPRWLPDMMAGFAATCRDPGLLRDVAALLTDDLADGARESGVLLRALADVIEAEKPEHILQRMDPDLATVVRKYADLPDLPPLKAAKTSRRGRHPRG